MKTKSILFAFAFLVCSNLSFTIYAQAVNVQDSLALVDFYNSTNGPGWKVSTNWLSQKPVSTWYGIDVSASRVTSIYLVFNDLKGTIPSSIGNLENLISIDFYINDLKGTIPSSIGNLVNLIDLYLNANQLTGSIPAKLGKLINLNNLYLEDNQLSGSIPTELDGLINLTNLNLAGNKLTGHISSGLGNFVNLRTLILGGNQLSGNIPPELGNLANLHTLDLGGGQLSGNIPPELGNLTNLLSLNLSYNQLSGSIPTEIINLSGLSYLGLAANHLSGSIPQYLGNLVNLYTLDLENNQLSGSIPSSLGNLVNPYLLYFSNNQLTGGIPSELGNLVNMKYFKLDNNQLSGKIPSELGNLVNLRELNLSYNHFTFDGMEYIAQSFPFAVYDSQTLIPLHQNNDSLSVSAGGLLTNNTYKWFTLGKNDSTIITGDSVFYPLQKGKYYASITNSICTALTLNTDTIDYDIALPLNIVNLKAQKQGSTVEIDWSSLTELNIASYEVERSSYLNAFSVIGLISAKGNDVAQHNYSFKDLQPLNGNNYYRLKAINKDGSITYSNIVFVKISSDKVFTIIYPVPAKDLLHIQTNVNTSFSFINQSGKILLTANIDGNGIINVGGFAAGLYYFKNNNTGAVEKVIISK